MTSAGRGPQDLAGHGGSRRVPLTVFHRARRHADGLLSAAIVRHLVPGAEPLARAHSHRIRALTCWFAVWVAVVAVILVVGARPRLFTPPIPECTGAEALSGACLVSRYETLTRSAGVQAALADLVERRKANSYLDLACHQITHVVGRTASERLGLAAFRDGTDLCASGYYHGVTEGVMQAIGPERIMDQAQTVCDEFRQSNGLSYLHYNCIHGMGHGFMAVFGTDVFRSLEGCDGLTATWERQHCYSGVFMENLTAMEYPERPSRHLSPDQPLYPCTVVQATYKEECYVKQTTYALYVRNGDFTAVFKLCQKDAEPDFQAVCYQGIGGDAAITSNKYVIGVAAQTATARQLCLLGPDVAARENCIAGVVTTIVRDGGGDDTKARALCAALDDRSLATVCEETREAASHGVPETGGAHNH
jgi:hypothetical protein